MSHKIYTTEAIVVGSRFNNTSDKSFLLFTRSAGMLWATGKSVREERSKQRFALQEFSLIRASLVKGRHGWRLGSVVALDNFFTHVDNRESRLAIVKVIKIIRQFLHGESNNFELFDDTVEVLNKLKSQDKNQLENLVDIFTLRFLFTLGYIAPEPIFASFLKEKRWWELPPVPKEAKKAIEKAQKFSHL